MTFKFIVVGLLLAVVIALFSGLYALMKGGREGQDEAARARMARSLTWRIGLSIVLFLILLVALRFGWTQSQ
jgi:TRAP-type C4-dicarboxylate transport system permease large subunit